MYVEPTLAPADYRQTTANYLADLPNPIRFKGALISDLKKSIAPQPAEWFACVRLKSGENYAIFITDGKVQQSRLTLGVDHCAEPNQSLPDPKLEKK